MKKYTFGDAEFPIWSEIKSFYDQYVNYSKDELLTLAKERRKGFINAINLKLKPLGLKKKANTWSISLNQHYNLSFSVEKSRFCDCYKFYYDINCIENGTPFRHCYVNAIGYEYKSQIYDYNWQCYSEAEFDRFFEFITKDILLPIINSDAAKLNGLIAELNTTMKPILLIPTKEDIKLINMIRCDLEKCDNCYKKTKA